MSRLFTCFFFFTYIKPITSQHIHWWYPRRLYLIRTSTCLTDQNDKARSINYYSVWKRQSFIIVRFLSSYILLFLCFLLLDRFFNSYFSKSFIARAFKICRQEELILVQYAITFLGAPSKIGPSGPNLVKIFDH